MNLLALQQLWRKEMQLYCEYCKALGSQIVPETPLFTFQRVFEASGKVWEDQQVGENREQRRQNGSSQKDLSDCKGRIRDPKSAPTSWASTILWKTNRLLSAISSGSDTNSVGLLRGVDSTFYSSSLGLPRLIYLGEWLVSFDHDLVTISTCTYVGARGATSGGVWKTHGRA